MNTPLRIVVSYTTLPSRYNILKKSLLSILNQTQKVSAIYLTIPDICKRLNKVYPPLPPDLLEICTVVKSNVDYGPCTKIYGALIQEKDPRTIIISCDDDVYFPPNYIEKMIEHHKNYPNSAICGTGALISRGVLLASIVSSISPFHKWKGFTGFSVGKEGRKVDLIFGVAGVLYTREMFPCKELLYEKLFKYTLEDDAIFHNDDVLISSYLSKNNIERRLFLDIPNVEHLNGDDALSSEAIKMLVRLNTSIKRVQELGLYTTMEPLYIDESPTIRVLFVLIIVLLIILLAIINGCCFL